MELVFLSDQPADSHSLLPLSAVAMMRVSDFIAGLVRAGKSANEIKSLADAASEDKLLMTTVIYNTLKKVKAGET
jgi:hypothetical protein